MIDFSDVKSAGRAFHYFLEISKIPRGSGNTAKIAAYLESFAKDKGLEYVRDAYDNVIIKKSATKGKEGSAPVILQGHTDIVAEKTKDCDKDMETEGLDVYRDGDFLRARGTTLGADNGVAVAYILAILESELIAHPPIEAVFTSDEETGLCGASGLDASLLLGKRMINLDSDDEGAFVVGCAGGLRIGIELRSGRTESVAFGYKLTVSGLLGGHSGSDINTGRANAVKLCAEVLSAIPDIRLACIEGGNKDNAIPREATAIFAADDVSFAEVVIEKIKAKYAEVEGALTVNIEKAELDLPCFDSKTSKALIALLSDIPYGVVKMSEDIEGLVETSINLGIMKTHSDRFEIHCSLRSSVESKKVALRDKIHGIAEKYGAEYEDGDGYPGWEYKKVSTLRDLMVAAFKEMYSREPVVYAIHAGLECGIISGKIEGLDCISLGPDNFDYHTTEEHLSISSADRVYEYLLRVLKEL